MKKILYSLWDSKALQYLPPFAESNDAMAGRQIASVLMDSNHPITQHAEDYALVKLASINLETGEVNGFAPETLFTVASLAAKMAE